MNIIDENNKTPDIWSVSTITGYIKNILTGDRNLRNVWVKGEISDFKRAYSGHCYFKLKDNNAILTCVMFRSRADGISFDIKDGMNVIAQGSITLYEKGGNYQLIVDQLRLEGLGELYLKFLQLKEKLQKKGYFDNSFKKTIPFLPGGIGVATSARGAALHDVITTITKRFPTAKVYIVPTAVQGDEAPASIVRSIKILDSYKPVDVIILGRGGGSFEDLNCFNDESVAEAIFNCNKPIISGVGHETDFTITDMVADYRAATPTAAAQKAVPRLDDLLYDLSIRKNRLIQYLRSIVNDRKIRLNSLKPDNLRYYTENLLNKKRQDLDYLMDGITGILDAKIDKYNHRLEIISENLNALNPFRVLERGYTIIKDAKSGDIISKASGTKPGEELNIAFSDGKVHAVVSGEPVIGVKNLDS